MNENKNVNMTENSHVASGLGVATNINNKNQEYLQYKYDCPCFDCVSGPVCMYSKDCIRLCEELGVGKTTDKPFSVAVKCCHKYSTCLPTSLDITYCHNETAKAADPFDESYRLACDPLP